VAHQKGIKEKKTTHLQDAWYWKLLRVPRHMMPRLHSATTGVASKVGTSFGMYIGFEVAVRKKYSKLANILEYGSVPHKIPLHSPRRAWRIVRDDGSIDFVFKTRALPFLLHPGTRPHGMVKRTINEHQRNIIFFGGLGALKALCAQWGSGMRKARHAPLGKFSVAGSR
jgi:hypothetical protein